MSYEKIQFNGNKNKVWLLINRASFIGSLLEQSPWAVCSTGLPSWSWNSEVAVLKCLILLFLNLCFINKIQWNSGACVSSWSLASHWSPPSSGAFLASSFFPLAPEPLLITGVTCLSGQWKHVFCRYSQGLPMCKHKESQREAHLQGTFAEGKAYV